MGAGAGHGQGQRQGAGQFGASGQVGRPTYDLWIVRKDFAEKHPEFLTQFVKVTGAAYAKYNADPKGYAANSANVDKIARLTGAKPGTWRSCWPATPIRRSSARPSCWTNRLPRRWAKPRNSCARKARWSRCNRLPAVCHLALVNAALK